MFTFDKSKKFGKGVELEPFDERDLVYDGICASSPPLTEEDWEKGYDVEADLNIKIPIKNQGGSSSCVGNGWAYYLAIINAVETGKYDEQSAKALYSQIFLPNGGAYIREGAKKAVSWGSINETIVSSYDKGQVPSEDFCRDLSWKNKDIDNLAKVLQSKEYRTIIARLNIDIFAKAIRDNHGVVSGVNGVNNGTWSKLEPKPPTSNIDWAHCVFFGVFGKDEKGKYIATPNSWGDNFGGKWQKLREDYFESGHMFNAWTLTDKPNNDMKKFRLIQQEGETAVWFIGQDGKRRFFFNEEQYKSIAPILGLSLDFSNLETLTKEEINLIPRENPIVVIK